MEEFESDTQQNCEDAKSADCTYKHCEHFGSSELIAKTKEQIEFRFNN